MLDVHVNPWRREVEADAHISEAMRLLSSRAYPEVIRLLDRASDTIEYTIDAAGYNSWEYRGNLGRHERVPKTFGKHTRHRKV